jgi:hypothetical protein
MSEHDEEFMNLIPKVLNGSLIHVGIQDVDIEYQSVSYVCRLKRKKDIPETCVYRLKTKKVHCYELKPPQFNYGVKGSEAIKNWGHLQEVGWAVMPNISNLPSTKDQGVRDLENPADIRSKLLQRKQHLWRY